MSRLGSEGDPQWLVMVPLREHEHGLLLSYSWSCSVRSHGKCIMRPAKMLSLSHCDIPQVVDDILDFTRTSEELGKPQVGSYA